jgi:hypothetical protein
MGILGSRKSSDKARSARRGLPPAAASNAPVAGSDAAAAGQSENTLQHRLTKELDRVNGLALMLASSRASHAVDVPDFLAAMYLNDWDRLERFWADPAPIERYLRTLCQVSPQRWHKWIQEYEAARQARERRSRRKFSLRKKNRQPSNHAGELPPSRGLQSVLRRAGRIAPGRDRLPERSIPILTSECVLLAMARDTDSAVGRRLASTGLNLEKLEREARKWRAPSGSK